jgi:thiamine biosynthesis lipoprotein
MGSPCEIRLYAASRSRAESLAAAAVAEVGRLEAKYSRYRDDSVTARINASAGDLSGVVVDDETAALLDYAATAHRESGGLFDITSGVLRAAWDFRSGRLPAAERVEALRSRVGFEKVHWERPRIALPRCGMELDFGGYVKEYAADCVASLCRARGAAHGLVDLGGDLAVVGPHPDGEPWRVGIRHPRAPETPMASVRLAAGGLASSGDYERFMVVDGLRYSHLLDPRTGWPVRGLTAVSVAAGLCLVAGTASTVAMLKGAAGAAWLDELGLPNLRMDLSGRLEGSLVPPREARRRRRLSAVRRAGGRARGRAPARRGAPLRRTPRPG